MGSDLTIAGIIACIDGEWALKAGDPTMGAWAAVLVYAVGAVLAGLVTLRSSMGQDRWFWALLCLLLAFLGANKQLDLQTALTEAGRCIARHEGWYERRRGIQATFIYALLGVASVAGMYCLWRLRRGLASVWLALLGLGAIAVFIGLRAVSFHHVDALLGRNLGDWAGRNWIELAGAGMIALNAGWLLLRRRR